MAFECINCGNSLIDAISISFDSDGFKKKTWEI